MGANGHQTVLISGTSTGIGAACMAGAGWKVYGGVRNKADGDTLIEQVSGDVTPVQLDVTSNDDIESVLARIADEVGGLRRACQQRRYHRRRSG